MPLRPAPTALVLLALLGPARADGPVYGGELEGFTYPFPVETFAFTSQGRAMRMAYLDVKPDKPNGRTAVLLHGKNFCAATWEETIRTLSGAGYRVVAPDQIGFCKSTKPDAYQYSFRQLAQNTLALLDHLGVKRVTLVGHSTGGMLAMRWAILHPESVEQLVLVSPIGLEDWSAKGVPPVSIETWMAREAKVTDETIRAYERATYYAGQWEERYEPPVQMLAGMYRGPGREAVARNSALLYDMIMTQPVVYELGRIRVPTLLITGDKDVTAIGKDMAPPDARAGLGRYADLAEATAQAIPDSTLVRFTQRGHAMQFQDPATFHAVLLEGLAGRLPKRTVR